MTGGYQYLLDALRWWSWLVGCVVVWLSRSGYWLVTCLLCLVRIGGVATPGRRLTGCLLGWFVGDAMVISVVGWIDLLVDWPHCDWRTPLGWTAAAVG